MFTGIGLDRALKQLFASALSRTPGDLQNTGMLAAVTRFPLSLPRGISPPPAGVCTGRIPQGEKPADLLVQRLPKLN
jgi:hypothetical protein